jgi:L-amino acid N-acyltransferase YncA
MSTPEYVTLRDGSAVEVRALERRDRSGLAAAIAHSLINLDHHGSEAFLAIDPATRQGVGVARYAEFSAEPGVVDVAVTVGDAWRRQGLATELLTRLLARARAEGHATARASVLADNAPSLALLHRAGFRTRSAEGPLLEMELALLP